jgi:hypothetical protein
VTPERPRDPNQLAKSISNLAPHYPLAAPQQRLAAPHVAPSGHPKVCSTAAIPALVNDLQRYRLRGAFGHRNERAGRRGLIPKMLIEIAPDALR